MPWSSDRRDGRSPLDHALNDGEDFELCVAVAPEDADRLLGRTVVMALYRVGEVDADARASGFERPGASRSRSCRGGFDHLR